jgi:hypothetical protein
VSTLGACAQENANLVHARIYNAEHTKQRLCATRLLACSYVLPDGLAVNHRDWWLSFQMGLSDLLVLEQHGRNLLNNHAVPVSHHCASLGDDG